GDSEQDRDEQQSINLTELATFVERMVAVAQRAGLASLEIEANGLELELKFGGTAEANWQVVVPVPPAPAPLANVPAEPEPIGYVINAPMVGTFYHSTSPADPPLVQVGDRVEVGQLIGIIEAMKIMNEITADRGGTVLEVMAGNATAVEYGSPLIRLGP
ncbi:MAG TPA: biotin/lipoyl-containing protein, partial [Thermomicrobiales bacterium]|nr:biotin/lipoyl-containing protein [Thermomicrobiales bacterium]